MQRNSLNLPFIPRPFASGETADRTFPLPSDSDPAAVNFTDGIPAAFSTDPSVGGAFLRRADLNAIGYYSTVLQHYLQCGGVVEYNATFQTSIGGYPMGAVVAVVDAPAAFDATRAYAVGDTVKYNDATYACKVAGTGPWSSSNWVEVQSEIPAFSSSSTYSVGDIVSYEDAEYICKVAVSTAGDWTGSVNWALLSATVSYRTYVSLVEDNLETNIANPDKWVQIGAEPVEVVEEDNDSPVTSGAVWDAIFGNSVQTWTELFDSAYGKAEYRCLDGHAVELLYTSPNATPPSTITIFTGTGAFPEALLPESGCTVTASFPIGTGAIGMATLVHTATSGTPATHTFILTPVAANTSETPPSSSYTAYFIWLV